MLIDIWKPHVFFQEGFMISPGENPFITGYFPRRGDVSFEMDEAGYIQDKRHVRGYADVQGLSVNHDFCRMIVPKGAPDEEKFFACALAGTENLSSTKFRTISVKQGLKTSRDDYMRDLEGEGRFNYCAVVKSNSATWEPQCYRPLLTNFDSRQTVDTEPPKDIADILYFYEGIMFWFRFIDDMKDYAENLKTYSAGSIEINEAEVKVLPSQLMDGSESRTTKLDERVQITNGLKFNGSDQFLRLGDSPDMGFGKKISLTTLRSLCFWVKFDEFTNNAHILDFGNGAGLDNVFVGIIGKGDESIDKGSMIRGANVCDDMNNTVPSFPSGAQPVPDMTPMKLMLSTSANVDDPPCEAPVLPRNLPPLEPLQGSKKRHGSMPPKTATLLYEVWNGKLRLQHVKVQGAFKLKQWTHVCITTASSDGVRPALQIWIDGKKAAEDPSAHLPQSSFTTNNYLGKSNWLNETSNYENKAELFNGSLFDVRGYNQAVIDKKLTKTIQWGKLRLGLK
jgi:Concanavalin A-like lectin/glucanases superfamily